MQNLIQGYQEKMISEGAPVMELNRSNNMIRPMSPESVGARAASPHSPTAALSRPQICLVIDNLPVNATPSKLEQLMKKKNLNYQKVVALDPHESVQFGSKPTLSFKIVFESREDLMLTADELVNK